MTVLAETPRAVSAYDPAKTVGQGWMFFPNENTMWLRFICPEKRHRLKFDKEEKDYLINEKQTIVWISSVLHPRMLNDTTTIDKERIYLIICVQSVK